MLIKRILVSALLLLVITVSFGQDKNKWYDRSWNRVDSLIERSGLTTTALTEVRKVYDHAVNERNDAQQIKALLYELNLTAYKDEGADSTNLRRLERELRKSTGAKESILASIAAEKFWIFLQINRYDIQSRTSIPGIANSDIYSWTVTEFYDTITSLYKRSLRSTVAGRTAIATYNPILIQGNARSLRPTIFDLLAHRAIEFYSTEASSMHRSIGSFRLTDPSAFHPAPVFAQHQFNSIDSNDFTYQELHVYQQLLSFHINRNDTVALIDADLHRLRFARRVGIIENSDSLYLAALEDIGHRFNSFEGGKEAVLMQAKYYAELGEKYDPILDTSNRYSVNKAVELLKSAQTKDTGYVQQEIKVQLANLTNTNLQFEAEQVNSPGLPFRLFVRYKNSPAAYFRIIRINRRLRDSLDQNRGQEGWWQQILKQKTDQQFQQSLPDTRDHQHHRVEIKAPALPVGFYAVIASPTAEFQRNNNLSVAFIDVTNIAIANNGDHFFVLHRQTGQPLANASIQLWRKEYNYQLRRQTDVRAGSYKTDARGYFIISPQKESVPLTAEISYQNDYFYAWEDEYHYVYAPGVQPETSVEKRLYLYTDRSLYRPGQKVFFKGLIVDINSGATGRVNVAHAKTTLHLFDANNTLRDSILVESSDYGSFNGSFEIPPGLLTGRYYILGREYNGIAEFNVEEYKRPTFVVELVNQKEEYRVNDSVKVNGLVRSYSGANMNAATVRYRIVREHHFPFPWFAKIYPPRGQKEEIAFGTATTDETGRFNFTFKAIPDYSVKRETGAIFHYTIITDVTDISGETRSAESSVPVGYSSLLVAVVPSEGHIPFERQKEIFVNVANLSGEQLNTPVTISISKLQPPTRLFRPRYWIQPDQFVLGKEEFYQLFPFDPYSNETQPEAWPSTGTTNFSDSTGADGKLELDKQFATPGWYKIEATAKDRFGVETRSFSYVELYDSANGKRSMPSYEWTYNPVITAKPGSKASVYAGTSADSVYLIQVKDRGVNNRKSAGQFNFLTHRLSRQQIKSDFPITEEDRGGFGVTNYFIKHNRVYVSSYQVQVPWSSKELKIEYQTFRDKLQPGAKETFHLKIRMDDSTAAKAEILSSLYDASLDQFLPHQWNRPDLYPNYYPSGGFLSAGFRSLASMSHYLDDNPSFDEKTYDQLDYIREIYTESRFRGPVKRVATKQAAPPAADAAAVQLEKAQANGNIADTAIVATATAPPSAPSSVQLRKNFSETAFFYPNLHTDSSGTVTISFTMPDAVTTWKWMNLAHTKELAFGYSEKTIITQKSLMVQANAPRFMREGDRFDFSGKITNLSSKEITGQVELQLIDPETEQSVDGWFRNVFPNQYFTAAAGESIAATFSLEVPFQYNKPVIYRLIARADTVSDGEQGMTPVLSNKILVTETLPIPVNDSSRKQFRFEKLLASEGSETIQHHRLTVEMTSNSSWYVIQALPFIEQKDCECIDQIFNRFYSNALASRIIHSSPKIKDVIRQWQTKDTTALLSNLQKNEELKDVLLQETPWVLEGQTETQQHQLLAAFFDSAKLNRELQTAFSSMVEMQSSNGGFVWIKGGREDRYMTQYLLTKIGHLKKLNAVPPQFAEKLSPVIARALNYLDSRIADDYKRLKKPVTTTEGGLSNLHVQYLYMRSFYTDRGIPGTTLPAFTYYRKLSQTNWPKRSRYMQGLVALSLQRTGDPQTAKNILRSLKENAIFNAEQGMYWKDNTAGYYWYQSPIETQSQLIEAFAEITMDTTSIDKMKTWLLKNKQTRGWRTSKATADACYALLLQGTRWLDTPNQVDISLGKTVIKPEADYQAGTGYYKRTFNPGQIQPSMGEITVFVQNGKQKQPAWGAVYWQYFESLENIKPAASPLHLTKRIFLEQNTVKGPELQPLNDGAFLKVGDKIKVRIELRSDRDMEYIHLKDLRASALEPVNVISSYRWQGRVGYYESTRDANTSFFFDYLPKGTHVFEYTLFATQSGTFNNGISSVQCLYAPEFSSHSESIRLNIEPK